MKPSLKFRKLTLSEPQKRNLPVFYNYVSYYEHPPQTLDGFHYNEQHQYYVNYFEPQKLISKIIRYDER